MKPYSTDLREKVIQADLRGDSSLRDIAKRFFVSLNFVWLLWQRYLTTGSVATKPHTGGRVSVMTEERLSMLRGLVEEQNDATLKELQENFRDKTGIMVSSGTLSRALKKLKLPRKKKTFHATELENNPDLIQKREEYLQEMPDMDAQHLVIIDEFGVNLGFSREYGRASPGQRAVGHRPCNTGGNVTVVAGLSRHGIIAPLIFPGASNGEIFKNYVEKVLAPELAPGDTALMDNLSAHKGQGIEDIFKASRITLKFLPPYSPDLSPMEQAISSPRQVDLP